MKKQLVVLLSSFLFAVGGIALAASPNWVNSGQVIYACVTGVNGNITKVSNVDHSCPRGSTPIYWNQQGLKGDTGLKGDQGVKGDRGDQGPAGADGIAPATGNKIVANDGSFSYSLISLDLVGFQNRIWNFVSTSGAISAIREPHISDVYFSNADCTGTKYIFDVGVAASSVSLSQGATGLHWQEGRLALVESSTGLEKRIINLHPEQNIGISTTRVRSRLIPSEAATSTALSDVLGGRIYSGELDYPSNDGFAAPYPEVWPSYMTSARCVTIDFPALRADVLRNNLDAWKGEDGVLPRDPDQETNSVGWIFNQSRFIAYTEGEKIPEPGPWHFEFPSY